MRSNGTKLRGAEEADSGWGVGGGLAGRFGGDELTGIFFSFFFQYYKTVSLSFDFTYFW